MYVTEQFWMYRFAYDLVINEKYELLHFNQQTNEIWLEKQEHKSTKIIRFIHHRFDWKNHLKTDIAKVFQRVKMMQKQFIGKHIDIYNIYVTDYEPVDDWESLKKPMVLKERKPVRMNIFYLTEENHETEEARLFKQINKTPLVDETVPTESSQEKALVFYKTKLYDLLIQKSNEIKNIFTYGKARFTYIFLIINIILFLLLEFSGGSTRVETLIQFGAKYNPAILDGQWWRLAASMFLHIGTLHLIMNMIALYYLGMIVERIYGSFRFIILYFLAGILGGLTSFAFNIHISAGASGAIFGLFGALLFFGLIYKRLFLQTMGFNVIFILLINLAIGLFIQQIDMGAHVGGLIGGFIASAILYLPNRGHLFFQLLATAGYLILCAGLLIYGISVNLHYFS